MIVDTGAWQTSVNTDLVQSLRLPTTRGGVSTLFVQREQFTFPRPSSSFRKPTGLTLANLVMHPENDDLEPARDYPVDYKREIYSRVLDQKFTPLNTPSGLMIVRFAFDRFGTLIFEKLAFKSQSDDLNQAAMKMVRMAAPFPLPPGLADDHVTMNFSISFDAH
jgi:TonB C terminal